MSMTNPPHPVVRSGHIVQSCTKNRSVLSTQFWIYRTGERACLEALAYQYSLSYFGTIVPYAEANRQRYVEASTAHSTPNLVTVTHTSPLLRYQLACLVAM